jgi:hypothetical protein
MSWDFVLLKILWLVQLLVLVGVLFVLLGDDL